MQRKTIIIAINALMGLITLGIVPYFFDDSFTTSSAATKRPWPALAEGDQGLDKDDSAIQKDLNAKNYYVIFDASGSMSMSGCSGSRDKMAVAKESLLAFSNAVPAGANLGMTVFDGSGVREVVPLGKDNREAFKKAILSLSPGGSTPLKSAMALGASMLEKQAHKQLSYGEYNLVVVTDGEANENEDPRPVVDDLLLNSPVVIHTIGFCIGDKHSLNQPDKILFKQASQPEQLTKGLEDVLAESESFDVTSFQSK